MSQTTRVYFQQPIQGRHRQNVQLSNVNTTSSVLVTAAEYNPNNVPPAHPDERVRNPRRRQHLDLQHWASR